LSLDDACTLTYYQNKLKQAQNDLLKSLAQTKKKQDKLLANVACDHGNDGVPARQNLGSGRAVAEGFSPTPPRAHWSGPES